MLNRRSPRLSRIQKPPLLVRPGTTGSRGVTETVRTMTVSNILKHCIPKPNALRNEATMAAVKVTAKKCSGMD